MKRLVGLVLSVVMLVCALAANASDGWVTQTYYSDGKELYQAFNKNSDSGFGLQMVFDKTSSHCLTGVSIVAGGYQGEFFSNPELNCVIGGERGSNGYFEGFSCAAYGIPASSSLMVTFNVPEQSAERILRLAVNQSVLSFSVAESEMEAEFDMSKAGSYVAQGREFCESSM